jgi:hypothetical protein
MKERTLAAFVLGVASTRRRGGVGFAIAGCPREVAEARAHSSVLAAVARGGALAGRRRRRLGRLG